MTRRAGESSVKRLRHEAEVALRRSRSRNEVEPLLERLEDAAEHGSEPWLFAHRHLAELRLESHPWRAALHLRQVLTMERDDDVVYALLGLCHALLGNYRSAVSAYRKALQLSPRNPWYHHNLGHLLDVALGQPEVAESHLRTANRMEPDEDEITASLAHCIARLDKMDEARELADEAVRLAPRNEDHRALLDWLEDGAPSVPSPAMEHPQSVRRAGEMKPSDDDEIDADPEPSSGGRGGAPSRKQADEGRTDTKKRDGTRGRNGGGRRRSGGKAASSSSQRRGGERRTPPAKAVVQILEREMRDAGFSKGQLERARALWSDFRDGRRVRVIKPEVYAAAVEYAIALVHGLGGTTKAAVARRYGVAPTSLSTRYGEIRDALSLQPGDSRYAVSH